MSSFPPYNVAGQAEARKKERYPGEGGDVKTKELLGRAGSAVAGAGRAVGRFLVEPRGEGMTGPPPMQPPPAAPKRKAADEQVTAQTTAATDPQKQPTAAPPHQGGTAPKTPEKRPSRDDDFADVDPTSFGTMGSAMVHSTGKPDLARQEGGFAGPGARTPTAATGFSSEPLPEKGTLTQGPRGATGGHAWTLRTPGAQEASYERARYGRAVQGRQATEEAELAELDAAAAQAGATRARSEALEEQPFAPEEAQISGRVGAERAKAQPEMARIAMAAELRQTFQVNLRGIEQALAEGKIDEEEADRLRRDQEKEYSLILAGVMPGFRVPKEDPLAGYRAGLGEEETVD